MKKYRVSLEVDKEWVKNFDLTFDAVDEQDAEAQAMMEVKMNLGDYITAYADEEDELLSKKIDAQYYQENKKWKHTKSQRVKQVTLIMKQK